MQIKLINNSKILPISTNKFLNNKATQNFGYNAAQQTLESAMNIKAVYAKSGLNKLFNGMNKTDKTQKYINQELNTIVPKALVAAAIVNKKSDNKTYSSKNITVESNKDGTEIKKITTYKDNSTGLFHRSDLVHDYKHNAEIKVTFVPQAEDFEDCDIGSTAVKSFEKTYINPQTKKKETLIMELSDIAGVFKSKIIDDMGNEHIESDVQKKKDGTTVITKNFKNTDGGVFKQVQEISQDGNKVSNYIEILDNTGKTRGKSYKSFERISPTEARSSVNGFEYIMRKKPEGIEVTDVSNNNEKTLVRYDKVLGCATPVFQNMVVLAEYMKLPPVTEYYTEDAKNFLDRLTGDTLLYLNNNSKSILYMKNPLDSFYFPFNNTISTGNDLFIAMHETGHSYDIQTLNGGLIIDDNIDISRRPTKLFTVLKPENVEYAMSGNKKELFSNIVKADLAAAKEQLSEYECSFINYFYEGGNNTSDSGEGEIIAETNAILSLATGKDEIGMRTYMLEKYCSNGIEALMSFLNPMANAFVEPKTNIEIPTPIILKNTRKA